MTPFLRTITSKLQFKAGCVPRLHCDTIRGMGRKTTWKNSSTISHFYCSACSHSWGVVVVTMAIQGWKAGGWKTTNGCLLVHPGLSVSFSCSCVHAVLFKRHSCILCCFSKADPSAQPASRLILHSSPMTSPFWEMLQGPAYRSCL